MDTRVRGWQQGTGSVGRVANKLDGVQYCELQTMQRGAPPAPLTWKRGSWLNMTVVDTSISLRASSTMRHPKRSLLKSLYSFWNLHRGRGTASSPFLDGWAAL